MGYFFSWLGLSKSVAETGLDDCEILIIIAGLILTLGAIGEYLEEHEKLPNCLQWPKIVFILMVVGGLIGEFIGDAGVFLFAGSLQTISDAEVADTNERGKRLENENLKLKKELIQQGHRATILHDPDINRWLVSQLKPFGGQKYEIEYCPTDHDWEQFEVVAALEYILGGESKWLSEGNGPARMCAAEIFVMVRSTAPKPTQKAADELQAALVKREIMRPPPFPTASPPLTTAIRSQAATPPAQAGIEPSAPDVVLIFVGPHP